MNHKKLTEIISGIAIGVLVGFIIGMSVSQVVGIVLGALVSLLAAFFGLKTTGSNQQDNSNEFKTLTLISFCFTCLTAIFAGVYIRSHNLFSVSIEDQIKEYKEIGINDSLIPQIILLNRFGISLGNGELNATNNLNMQSLSSSLFKTNTEDKNSTTSFKNNLSDLKTLFNSRGQSYEQFYNLSELYINDTIRQKQILIKCLELINKK